MIKQKRINGKPGKTRHKPLRGTHRIPHTHLNKESNIEIAYFVIISASPQAGVIAIPNPQASNSDFIANNRRPSREGSCQNLATSDKDNATLTLTESYEGELYKACAVEDDQTYHLLPVIVANGAPLSQLRLYINKQIEAIPLARQRRPDYHNHCCDSDITHICLRPLHYEVSF